MSETDEQKPCSVCSLFEPQTWRKSLCKNCFHSLDEHSEELLAQEAESAARQKATDKTLDVSAETSIHQSEAKREDVKPVSSRLEAKGEEKDTNTETKTTKRKFGPVKDDGPWSWAKDLGREYSKSVKPVSHATSKSAEGHPISTSSAQPPSAKPSVKTSIHSSSQAETSTSKPVTTSASAVPETTTISMSKAKTFASRFEAKASELSKDKPSSKPPDIGPSSSNVAALTGKLTDNRSQSSKISTEKQAESNKPDTKSTQKTLDETKLKEGNSNISKTEALKSSKDSKAVGDDVNKQNRNDLSGKKTSIIGSKFESKDSSVSVGSKSAPFGKDLLRSTKDLSKRGSLPVKTEESQLSLPRTTDNDGSSQNNLQKSFSGKKSERDEADRNFQGFALKLESEVNNEKQKKTEDALVTQAKTETAKSGQSESKVAVNVSCSSRDAEHADRATKNSMGHMAKSSGISAESQVGLFSDKKDITAESGDEYEAEGKRGSKNTTEFQTPSLSHVETGADAAPQEHGGDHVNKDTSPTSSSTDGEVSFSSSVSSPEPTKPTVLEPTDSSSLSALSNSRTEGEVNKSETKSCHQRPNDELESSNAADGTTSDKGDSFSIPCSNINKTNDRDEDEDSSPQDVKDNIVKLNEELAIKEKELSTLSKLITDMEQQVKNLEEERDRLRKASIQSQKDDVEKMLNDLRAQLSKMEGQCTRLETDNQALIDKLRAQEASVKRDQESRGKNSDNIVLEEDLEAAEKELEDVKDENKELQSQIMEMKNEMEEMHDHFREHEHDEFRQLQKELDLTAKNCRILQYKLRKAERRNEQIESDRQQYEEKLRALQDKFDSQDAKHHIRVLEDELRVAKEVSSRLRDELDIIEDKRDKALEENRHLTELLEHTDKRQFRMEMEIDKLRDIVSDLKMQLKETKGGSNKESTPERKLPLGVVGKQGSREYDVSQLMKDLYDSMERENDLKDQLKFTEEEAKMMRKRVSEMDEENESLRVQLQKMSEKASKHKKKEKERLRELEEERKHCEAYRSALSTQSSQDDDNSTDVILIVGPEGSDIIAVDEVIPVTQRKDSTDEDLMNVMQMRVQLEMMEQELMTSHKKLDEMDLENENLQAEVKFLQERLAEREAASSLPEPSTPNAYYEDKLKEINQEVDELRWKLIEKDRELERLSAVQASQTRHHSREHSHRTEKLKKSKSLEEADHVQADLRKQLDHAQMEIIHLKKNLEETTEQTEELLKKNEDLLKKNEELLQLNDEHERTPVPSVQADDAAIENIELKENVRRLEEINRVQVEKIKTLSENLQKLARDTRSFTNSATSPTTPGTLGIPGIPLVGPARAAEAGSRDDVSTRDLRFQLHVIEKENEEQGRLINEQQASTRENRETQLAGKLSDSRHAPASPGTDIKKKETRERSSGESGQILTCSQPTQEDQVCDKGQVSEDYVSETEMEREKNTAKPATVARSDHGGGKTKGTDEDSSDGIEVDKVSKARDEQAKSVLVDYPEGKSKVVISGSESRVELMTKVLEMDEEIGDLVSLIRKREDECEQLKKEVSYLNVQMRDLRDESRRTELELLQELDMLHDKNSVLSNLLDIINERAEAAEEELERRMQEDGGLSPVRSASNVSQVSALSDTSMGSDEVFLNAHVTKEGVITRDWEAKLKVRIESLERLLAEERQKVCMAEKKLILAGIDSMSPSLSDDVKLRIREKELLQEELLKSQRHLHIATDQIQGLKERMHILEDEHQRLKKDYAKLYDEIDKPLDKDDVTEHNVPDSDKNSDPNTDTELPFVAKRISVVEAPQFQELKRLSEETSAANEEISRLQEELSMHKEKAKELEYKVEEINDIWRSKSAASDRERDELELQLNDKLKEMSNLEETVAALKREMSAKDKIITENDATLKEREQELSRLAAIIKDRENESKNAEEEKQTFLEQISHRDNVIRALNETVRIRDERLKEKDEILFKLNTSIEDQKREMVALGSKMLKTAELIKEKDVEISTLKCQLSNFSSLPRDAARGCQTDAEKENFRLKEMLKKHQGDLDKATTEKRTLETSLEKSRKALDEAMMMWDKDRHALQREANILEEKVRMYEAFNTMNKDETIDALKVEAQGYFNEKESLVCELSTLRLRHEADERVHKEQISKLQAELTEKLRLLKAEVDNNGHINTEMNRLKRQAEMAYRLQQEQRVFKAENLAMKVRYETRIDKMSKEHNKMLLTIEKLQTERDMDKQIIESVQKNFSLVKDKYTEELLRSQDDKTTLHRYVKEIEELREHLEGLQKHIRDLRDKTVDQDKLRSELISKFATERSSWEIERANLNSQINEMDERINSSCRQQERSKDIQVNMGMAWEKERREQRRLLAEAHTLALDLQEQLRSRDETFTHEKKELLHQMENDRVTWNKDKREIERKLQEAESVQKRMAALEKRLKDLHEKTGKDAESWNKEKLELLRLAGEARHAHARDTKKVENVLSQLIRLRELGMMLTSQPKWDSLEEKPPDRLENTDQSIIDYVKETVLQVSQVADDLMAVTNPTQNEEAINRISNSEIDLLKNEYSRLHQETNDVVVVADVSTSSMTMSTRIQEESSGISRKLPNNTGISNIPSQPHPVACPETVSTSSDHSRLSSSQSAAGSHTNKTSSSVSAVQCSNQVRMRPQDSVCRWYDRPPSYTSGTRSATSSRAATPEAYEHTQASSALSSGHKLGFPELPPSFVIPHKVSHPQTQEPKLPGSTSNSKGSPKRPSTFMKSLSMDSASILDNHLSAYSVSPQMTSISANTTPIQPVTSADMISSFSTPSAIDSRTDFLHPASKSFSYRISSHSAERFSPRTARRKFFDDYPASSSLPSHPIGYMSWPDRRSVSPSIHVRQTSLPDPEDVRREAEEEHDLVTSRLESWEKHSNMKSSTSWDEQIHQRDKTHDTEVRPELTHAVSSSMSLPRAHQPGGKTGAAKDKRKLFKRATSLESPIGSSIAKVGVAAMVAPGAPTGFTPSELFASVKGKLKPVFKKKSTDSRTKGQDSHSSSPVFIQTEVPDVHPAGHGPTPLPIPAPQVDVTQVHPPGTDQQPEERSRDSQRSDGPRGKWRSKSADRAHVTIAVHGDVIRPQPGVWQFNETAV